MSNPKGRKPTTGRYQTRQELIEAVWQWYDMPKTTITSVARVCRVSQATVNNILKQGRACLKLSNTEHENEAIQPERG